MLSSPSEHRARQVPGEGTRELTTFRAVAQLPNESRERLPNPGPLRRIPEAVSGHGVPAEEQTQPALDVRGATP